MYRKKKTMSVYIFSEGKSVYGDAIASNKVLVSGAYYGPHSIDVSGKERPQLSTMVLRENTTASEIIEFSRTLRGELEQIRQLFFSEPKPEHLKDYEKFLRVQQRLLDYGDELVELYQAYEAASQLTANRKSAIRQKIINVGLKISALVRSYNTSGMFANKETFVSVPMPNSYEEVLRARLLQSLE